MHLPVWRLCPCPCPLMMVCLVSHAVQCCTGHAPLQMKYWQAMEFICLPVLGWTSHGEAIHSYTITTVLLSSQISRDTPEPGYDHRRPAGVGLVAFPALLNESQWMLQEGQTTEPFMLFQQRSRPRSDSKRHCCQMHAPSETAALLHASPFCHGKGQHCTG